jgi:hypothetical protein
LVERGIIVTHLEIFHSHDDDSQGLTKNDNKNKRERDVQHRYRAGWQHGFCTRNLPLKMPRGYIRRRGISEEA